MARERERWTELRSCPSFLRISLFSFFVFPFGTILIPLRPLHNTGVAPLFSYFLPSLLISHGLYACRERGARTVLIEPIDFTAFLACGSPVEFSHLVAGCCRMLFISMEVPLPMHYNEHRVVESRTSSYKTSVHSFLIYFAKGEVVMKSYNQCCHTMDGNNTVISFESAR